MATTDKTPESKETIRAGKIMPPTGQQGRTGTINSGGFIMPTETNADLAWPRSLEVFDEMRRTEASVRGTLGYLTMPIRAAEWEAEAPNDTPEAVDVAAFVQHNMENVEGGLSDLVRRMLTFLSMGFWLGERRVEFERVAYGDTERDAFVIKSVFDRLQRTVQKWHDHNGAGPLEKIEQWVAATDGSSPNRMLDRDRLMLLVNEQEGSNYFGTSLLRAIYANYYYKRKIELIEAIGIERAVGVPVVYTPDGATPEQLDELEEHLQNLHAAESMYLIMPGQKQLAGSMGSGWLVDTLEVHASAENKANAAIQRHEAAMARIVLAEFMRLGHNEAGARATADTQSGPYEFALKAVAGQIGEVLTREFATPLVRYNYGPNMPVPKIVAVGLEKADLGQTADAFQKFAAAGGITMTAKDEQFLRAILNMPDIDEADRQKIIDDKRAEQQRQFEQKASLAKVGALEPQPAKDGEKSKSKQTLSSRRHVGGFEPSRDLRPEEQHIAWAAIDAQIDAQRLEFEAAGKVHVANVAAAITRGDKPDTTGLSDDLLRCLVDTATFGAVQVERELQRQRSGAAFEARPSDLPKTALEELQQRVGLAVETVVASVGAAVQRIKITNLRRRGVPETDLIDAGAKAGEQTLRHEALQNVTGSLNLGRDAEAKRQGVQNAVYSSVLDTGTCSPCANADGSEVVVGSTEYDSMLPPNPSCQGAGACRCIYAYIGDESV